MTTTLRLRFACTVAALILTGSAWAAPFAERLPFQQPDGTAIVLWGEGDEFYAVFETLDGYTVAFNPATQAYHYAKLSADGSELRPVGPPVGKVDPRQLGLIKHQRINQAARQKQVSDRFKRWDEGMRVTEQWAARKAAVRLAEAAAPAGDDSGPLPAPPSFSTTGTKIGLTLLIDFSDDPNTVPQASIIDFCNGDSYTGYGNNGSVKKYFSDNSNGLLTYTNVVTIYIRAPQPKSYYNDTTKDAGTQGRLLIKDALDAMKALPNYTTEILPAFDALTADGNNRVVAFNAFYAGGNGGVWSYGLWPHSWSLQAPVTLGNGKSVSKYQLTNIGSSLSLGTFCHENGHMLCGYPDIYDYGYDSAGGAGGFCLMNSGGHGGNPVQICAYLKRASGWATTVPLYSNSVLAASVSASGADFNKFYRYQKPNVATEYYLIENRQRTGRDANIAGGGIAIWHIDELGNKDNQSTIYNSSHLNYEVSLMQADNLWHFQQNINSGDPNDLYYLGNTAAGYANQFNDTTGPSARWWDGSNSGLRLSAFSSKTTTMTFQVGVPGVAVIPAGTSLSAEGCLPTNGGVDPGETVTVSFGLQNIGNANATNLVATLLATGGVTSPSGAQTYGALVGGGAAVSRPFTFTANGSCGGTIQAVLQLQDGAVNRGTLTNTITLGALSPPITNNYTSGGIAVAIPDYLTVEVPIVVPDAQVVADVNVKVRLNHTWDSDLVISLVHPDGTVVTLASGRGDSGDNFGSGAANCTGTFTVFDDSAATAISTGSAPFAGSYRPDSALAVLNGKTSVGTWKLRIQDLYGSDTGTVYCCQVDIARQTFVCCTNPDSDGDGVPDLADNCPAIANPAQENLDGDAFGNACDSDIDGDGMPNTWETARGLDPYNAADAGLDTDGDGCNSLREYLAGTDPRNATDALRITAVTVSGNNVLVTFTTASGKFYDLERSLSPALTSPSLVTNNVPGTGSPVQVTDPGAALSASPFFYRVRLQQN